MSHRSVSSSLLHARACQFSPIIGPDDKGDGATGFAAQTP
jgi:hypothetical protein